MAENRRKSGTLRLGASSWSSKDWLGKLYPPGTKPVDFIREYAKKYSTVEIDATFYGVPKAQTILGWKERTPESFLFAAKVPKIITHDRFLEECEWELNHFLKEMSILERRLGPILFQFPHFAKKQNVTLDEFLLRWQRFTPLLPKDGFRFAVEIRNKTWLNAQLFDFLHEHGLALAFIHHPWMPTPEQLFRLNGLVTGGFAYIRWLGDRMGIEKITKVWNQTVIDRRADLERWTPHVREMLDRQLDVFGYVNNHYAGYAPENIDTLTALLASESTL